MSLSPSKSSASKSASALHQPEGDRLTRSQALIITAGLAGLLGLCGGAAIRFSLANASNTRFLSPLQTFPELSNWTSTPAQNAVDSQTSPERAEVDGSNRPSEEVIRMPAFDAMEPLRESGDDQTLRTGDQAGSENSLRETEVVDITTFDAFAARDDAPTTTPDPLETLRRGPSWSRPN